MTWTYKNIGLTRLLTSDNVYQLGPGYNHPFMRYGAMYSQMNESACFGIAAAGEIWARFAFARWANNTGKFGDGTGGFTGVVFDDNSWPSIYVNGTKVTTIEDYCIGSSIFNYWIHLKSGVSDGVVEFILYDLGYVPHSQYTYTGNVNNGNDFSDVYSYSAEPGLFWGDIVISDSPITANDHAEYDINLDSDTRRTITNTQWPVTINGDTLRDVIREGLIVFGDTARVISNAATIAADTKREVENTSYHVITLSADTRRRVANRVTINGNTRRRIPRIVETDFTGPPYPSDGITAINLSLQEGTITDTASYGTVIHTLPKDELKGYILDFPYSFICESTNHSGQEMTARCTYDVDRLLYETFYIKERDEVLAGVLVSELAKLMEKALVYTGRRFTYKQHIGGKNQTYKGIVSNIFGWSSRVPRMQYNVFIRNDKLIVLQRGYETGVVNLDEMPENWIASLPTIEREITRTMSAKNIDAVEPDIMAGYRPRVFIDGGDDEYNDEVVSYENLSTPAGEVDSRPSLIIRNNADGSTTYIHYYYQWTGTNYVLKEELEQTWDAEGTLISQTHTYHEILAGGWRNSVSIAQDEQGNTIGVGSTGGRTRPGDMKTSAYSDQVKLARGGKWKGVKDAMPGGTALVDTDFPVDDTMALLALSELYWMNQRIKETVTLDLVPPVTASVPAYQHIIDFTDRIIYGGNEYFLSSNNISFTPTGHRQSLRLVRWF